tara:strand:+ start:216 stop:617 length:402 start_codon:yes stop_codon:yes gene_type:complete
MKRSTRATVIGVAAVGIVTAIVFRQPLGPVDKIRVDAGLDRLQANSILRQVAVETLGSDDEVIDGENPTQRARRLGYDGVAGCSLAWGHGNWAGAVDALMLTPNSQNILGDYDDIGMAHDGDAFVIIFGRRTE